MTDPTENEEINEELSTDELKSVSGGYTDSDITNVRPIISSYTGSGSGMTNEDYKKSNKYTQWELDFPGQ